jgi:hypothetical protein
MSNICSCACLFCVNLYLSGFPHSHSTMGCVCVCHYGVWKIINIQSPEIDDEHGLMVVVNNSTGTTPVPDTGL